MRIIEAEPQLVKDLLEEMDLIGCREHPTFKVHAGRHPTLGKIVVVEAQDGSGAIVETDE
jgi:hypothetical protein